MLQSASDTFRASQFFELHTRVFSRLGTGSSTNGTARTGYNVTTWQRDEHRQPQFTKGKGILIAVTNHIFSNKSYF